MLIRPNTYQVAKRTTGLLIFMIFAISNYAQYIKLDTACNITRSVGNDLNPSWSADGSRLVFQSDRFGNWDIFQYDLAGDTIIQLTNDTTNEQYPSLLQKGNRLTFTSDITGEDHLFITDSTGGQYQPVFRREISSRAASFPGSEYALYCLGLNTGKWGLYRYEFNYNTLKLVFPLASDQYLPKISADGENILIVSKNAEKRIEQLNVFNWYGNIEQVFSDFNIRDASWYPDGLKLIFISDMDNKAGEIYTMWKDGSHLERWTHDSLAIKNPVVSPTGKFLAVSVLVGDKYNLFVVPLEDY